MKLPPHLYIPGKTERHPEGFFDDIRDTAEPGMDAQSLAECHAFKVGLSFLEEGYFWEAHEVLEPVWLALPQNSAERFFVQGLIQLANARLKKLMDQKQACKRLLKIAEAHFIDAQRSAGDRLMGVDVAKYQEQIKDMHNNA